MASTVLIAHGNTQRLKHAVEQLRVAGFEVVATPDGGDAFARFFECEPSLVLCNVALPSLEGPSFASMVRSQAPDLPVIILREEDEEVSSDDPGVHVLQEPLSIEALRGVVPELMPAPLQAPKPGGPGAPRSSSASVFIHAALKRFQRDSNLLGLLDSDGLRKAASVATHEVRGNAEIVVRQGDPGDSFYLVVEGQVRVTLAENEDQEVARIGPGGFFGEMALLSDKARSASVWTVGPTTLLRFEKEAFLPILEEYPVMRDILSGVALKRTEENLWRVLFDESDVAESLESLRADAAGAGLLLDEPGAAPLDEEELPAAGVGLIGEADGAQEQTQGASGTLRGQADPTTKAMHADAEWAPIAPAEAPPTTTPPAMPVTVRPGFWAGLAVGVGIGALVTLTGMLLTGGPDNTGSATDTADADLTAVEPMTGDQDLAMADAEEAGDADVAPVPQDAEPQTQDAPEPSKGQRSPEDFSPEELEARKEVRRAMFKAFRDNKMIEATQYGKELRDRYFLDWEAQYHLADAQRQVGERDASVRGFLEFARQYPDNHYADNAYFWVAEMMKEAGDTDKARRYYEKVLKVPDSDFKSSAEQRLQELQ